MIFIFSIIAGLQCSVNLRQGMKVEINHRKRNEKKLTTWRLNNMLVKKKQWVNEEMLLKNQWVKKIPRANDSEDTTTQNLWDAAKTVLRRKYMYIYSNHDINIFSSYTTSFIQLFTL